MTHRAGLGLCEASSPVATVAALLYVSVAGFQIVDLMSRVTPFVCR